MTVVEPETRGPVEPAGAEQASEAKANAFLHKVLDDWGATLGSALVVIGDKLGLYDALAAGPLTPAQLADRTGTDERYCREWLLAQAAGGYLEYDASTGRYTLPAEHAAVLGMTVGGFELMNALTRAEPRIVEAFRSGGGLSWGEHHPDVFEGCERFFRPGYKQHLASAWIPALEGIEARLHSGGRFADVGCGHGASSIIVADATAYPLPEAGYDLIAFFDCLHDMVDPIGALRHAGQGLAEGGSILLVAPMAGEQVQDNLNPVGRVYAGASVLVCTPNSLAGAGLGLGTLASEARLREVAAAAGLGTFRRVAETPFNRIFEIRR